MKNGWFTFNLNGTISVSLKREASPVRSLLSSSPTYKEWGKEDESDEQNGQQRKGDSGQVFLDRLQGQQVAFIDDEAQCPAYIHSTDLKHR